MKYILSTAAALLIATGANAASQIKSDGLFTLATTGWADEYAAEIGGTAYDKTGGMPGMFTYEVDTDLSAARAKLKEGEFLAPHFALSSDGTVTVMVAPHLLVNGEVMAKANVQQDNFIVIFPNGKAARYDYSDDTL